MLFLFMVCEVDLISPGTYPRTKFQLNLAWLRRLMRKLGCWGHFGMLNGYQMICLKCACLPSNTRLILHNGMELPCLFSMGGLVVKQMLQKEARAENNDNLVNNTVGIVFYSCPHFGSKLADMPWRLGLVLRQQDIVIPGPSSPGLSYVKYLEELADNSAPLFLCHFYNIYFSHIAGGQVIAKQITLCSIETPEVSDKILQMGSSSYEAKLFADSTVLLGLD
ncbi:uncharacterized protein [Euphorbia lathyris]|uniref:uncharacterized protein isoform X2 n=1 Tax=Euphorbia lathyris TaxID=212925 RepID=UPI0033136B10